MSDERSDHCRELEERVAILERKIEQIADNANVLAQQRYGFFVDGAQAGIFVRRYVNRIQEIIGNTARTLAGEDE